MSSEIGTLESKMEVMYVGGVISLLPMLGMTNLVSCDNFLFEF